MMGPMFREVVRLATDAEYRRDVAVALTKARELIDAGACDAGDSEAIANVWCDLIHRDGLRRAVGA